MVEDFFIDEDKNFVFKFDGKNLTSDNVLLDLENEVSLNNDFQARRYFLTINNPVESDEEFKIYLENLEHIKYFIFQREIGEETHTEHFQVFLIFTIGKRFSTIKKLFPRAHIEKAKGNNIQCRDYCSKTETRISGPYEFGEFAEERARTDLNGFIELIKNGASDLELLELYPTQFLRNSKMVTQIRHIYLEAKNNDKRKENFICVYIYGKSRVGKTSALFDFYGNTKAYFIKDYNRYPFDNYKNQDVVVFDEYRSQIELSLFLNLLDIYPIELSCRYHNKIGNYTKVFVISNWSFEKQYSNIKIYDYDSYKAFTSRIHFILNFTKDDIFVEKALKPVELLKDLLPDSVYSRLNNSRLNETTNKKEIIQQFEIVPDDELPF